MTTTVRQYDEAYQQLMDRIKQNATPFPNDTKEKKEARKRRGKVDRFFFAVTYLPHYVEVAEEYRNCWMNPDGEYDWIKAGFSLHHPTFFKTADLVNVFSILAAFREGAKDTLIGKVDLIHGLAYKLWWYVPVISMTKAKAESKTIPIKIELEMNARLINDFGKFEGKSKWENDEFVTKGGRKVQSFGIEQSLHSAENSGHRPDHLILTDISDPWRPDSAKVVEDKVNAVKKDILKSVNSPHWNAIMLCNYSVKGDVTDELMTGENTGHFNKVICRALIPNEKKTPEDKEIARQCRLRGYPDFEKSAWEYRFPTINLLKDRKDDEDTFDTEMMMRPKSRKGQIFHDDWFRYHRRPELDLSKYPVIVTAVDPSGTTPGDPKAVVTVAIGIIKIGEQERMHIPVLKADAQQADIDWMLDTSYRHVKDFKSMQLAVADNAYKDFVDREYKTYMVKKHKVLPFVPETQVGNKEGRIATLAPDVKNGIVTFDLDDPDQKMLIRQLKAEPNPGSVSAGGIGDDLADTLELAVSKAKRLFDLVGIQQYKSVSKRQATFKKGAY